MNLSNVGWETLLFHNTTTLEKFLRRTYRKRQNVKALNWFLKNKDLIQKVDKANTVVILKRKYNVSKIKNILHDRSKFEKVYVDKDKILNHPIPIEKGITDILKSLRYKK